MLSNSNTVMPRHSLVSFDVLSSMIAELVAHHDRSCDIATHELDWKSPTSLTHVIRYGSSINLHSLLNQVPDAVVAEYQLRFKKRVLYAWKDYRWPHLLDTHTALPTSDNIIIPDECFNELMSYHKEANTSWYDRYQATLRRESAA